MSEIYSHCYAIPFELISETADSSKLSVDDIRTKCLEYIHSLSDADFLQALNLIDCMAVTEDHKSSLEINREELNASYPLHDWFKAIDASQTEDGYLQWQLKQSRADKAETTALKDALEPEPYM